MKNSELFDENHKLHDNVIMMHQKISDELMEEKKTVEKKSTVPLSRMSLTGNNVSLLDEPKDEGPPKKQGQGGIGK